MKSQHRNGPSDFQILKDAVVDQGLCTGCGTCVGVCPWGLVKMHYPMGEPEPILVDSPCRDCGFCISACPGKDIPLAAMEKMVFGQVRDPNVNTTGIFQRCYQSHAVDETIRFMGSSGGSATAMLSWALDKKVVEAVIVAGFDDAEPYRQQPKIATDSRELTKHARSKHGGASSNNEMLWEAVYRRKLSSIGLMGLPCHIHGLRKIQLERKPKRIAEAVKFAFGLFCGTNHYFEGTRHLLKEWCNVESLDEIAQLDYRWGAWPGCFYVRTKDGREINLEREDYILRVLTATYQRDRCQMCLDYTAEVADVAFGDLGAPPRSAGSPPWNLVIARTKLGVELVEQATRDGYLHIEPADLSQRPMIGNEMKKHGNAYRWNMRKRHNRPVPDFGFAPMHEPEMQDSKTILQYKISPRFETK